MTQKDKRLRIIQGGMGVGVSDWRLARAVSRQGQMGVVSGTAINSVVARRLQSGDPGGHIRRALASFPYPDMAERILKDYFIEGGKPPDKPFKLAPMPAVNMSRAGLELMAAANFVEVFLAKEGHDGPVGVNYLEKVQLPTLPSLFGAMLAGVDYVLMGGGIPMAVPGILDGLSVWDPVTMKVHTEGDARGLDVLDRFEPAAFGAGPPRDLVRPKFLAIISSELAAKVLLRRATGNIDGFIVENHTAGGHNAPPRKSDATAEDGGPCFGLRDVPDIPRIKALGRPFWLAGGYASPEKLREALDQGAEGIQAGTVFAYCRESGIRPDIKKAVLKRFMDGTLVVKTDFLASPTGYPFKLIGLNGAIRSMEIDEHRPRRCDLGYLRQVYGNGGSGLGYRCPAEPVNLFVKKGGTADRTRGKQCLCNGLLSAIGLGQVRKDGRAEPPLVTAGEDFSFMARMLEQVGADYGAKDVIDYLRSGS